MCGWRRDVCGVPEEAAEERPSVTSLYIPVQDIHIRIYGVIDAENTVRQFVQHLVELRVAVELCDWNTNLKEKKQIEL